MSDIAGTGLPDVIYNPPSLNNTRSASVIPPGSPRLSIAWHTPDSLRTPAPWVQATRRVIEILGSTLVLLLVLPTLLLIAAAIAIDSRGPIFYRQDRVGMHGKVFRLIKFRSMRTDAEAAGPQWAVQGDPRVTRVGRVLRRTRLDEVPQLMNVILGPMSIIGPRPERPVFVDQLRAHIPNFDDRVRVRPGITGWAQVNCSYGASIEDARQKLDFDLAYLANRSIMLDLRIILLTLRVMVSLTGSR